MNDIELLALMKQIDPATVRVPPGIKAIVEAALAAERWITTAHRLPEPGQLVVKRWGNGNVWAGRHVAHPKHESFAEWMPL